MKYIAGCFKDQEDDVFLMPEKGLVNRQVFKEIVVRVKGEAA